jgi:hypothetical protein
VSECSPTFQPVRGLATERIGRVLLARTSAAFAPHGPPKILRVSVSSLRTRFTIGGRPVSLQIKVADCDLDGGRACACDASAGTGEKWRSLKPVIGLRGISMAGRSWQRAAGRWWVNSIPCHPSGWPESVPVPQRGQFCQNALASGRLGRCGKSSGRSSFTSFSTSWSPRLGSGS